MIRCPLKHVTYFRSKRLQIISACFFLLFLGSWLGIRSSLDSPEPTRLILDRSGQFLGEVPDPSSVEVGYWPLDSIPPRIAAAILGIEDRRFYHHPGVDLLAVLRAIQQNITSRTRISGASTIAMQTARLQQPAHRGYFNKIRESVIALTMTMRHGREAVLRHFLRIAPYGNGIRGIAYAARRYFNKPVEDLSWAEIAFLSAIPQAPARMNPYTPIGKMRAIARGLRILDILHQQNHLNDAEYELARNQIRTIEIPERSRRPVVALHAILKLQDDLKRPEIRRGLGSRTIIRSTLDLNLQKEIESMTDAFIQKWEYRGARNAAVIVTETGSNDVLAWVGSTGYFDAARNGSIDYNQISRSSGSTLKPFIYALGLDRGVIRPDTILDDIYRGAGDISNADDAFLGPLLPRVALANSRNVPAAELLNRIGLDEGYDFLKELGLHSQPLPAQYYGLGLAIGGLPVSLEHLVRAYTALSGDGRLSDLHWYIDLPAAPPRRIFKPEIARLITLFLSDPMARLPTFPRMGALEYSFPVAVKTGTSSNYRNAWTVAYSKQYLTGVWVGNPDFRPMNHLSGYVSAARLAQEIMNHLHPDQIDGLESLGFPPPEHYMPVRICGLTGKRSGPETQWEFVEWFPPGQAPQEYSDAYILKAVDTRTGKPASPDTPVEYTDIRSFLNLAPRYTTWLMTDPIHNHAPRSETMTGSMSWDRFHSDRRGDNGDFTKKVQGHSREAFRMTITSPQDMSEMIRDPETPEEMNSISLRAEVDPPSEQVVWMVDGKPWKVVDYPYTTRWVLTSGEHTFQIRLPFVDQISPEIRIRVL